MGLLTRRRFGVRCSRRCISTLALYTFAVSFGLLLIELRGFHEDYEFVDANSESDYDYDDLMVSDNASDQNPVVQLFRKSCHVNLLGLPDYVSALCPNNVTGSPCRNLTCRNLLSGAIPELYPYAKEFMSNHSKQMTRLPDLAFVELTQNCTKFIQERGYYKKMRLVEDSDFPIAFNLLVHHNAELVERLIYSLYRPQNQICIHADGKSNRVFIDALTGIARCLSSNVFIASKLERVNYGGFSRLQADINCMKDHMTRGGAWKYIINTAGEAFPLRSQREMVRILKLYNGTNDIEGIYTSDHRKLYEEEYIEKKGTDQIMRTGRSNPPMPHDFDAVKGSAYAAFTREFVEFVLTDRRARDLLDWFRTTWSPDEYYWATLNHRYINPHIRVPGGYSGYPTQANWLTAYVNWDTTTCRGRLRHYICVAGTGDLPYIVRRRELFFNKFHANFEPLALDCLRAWIEYKDACPVQFNYDAYRELPRVKEREGRGFT